MTKNSFAVSNPPKCIANLLTQPMHFKMNLEIYQTQKVMNLIVAYERNIFNFKWLDLRTDQGLHFIILTNNRGVYFYAHF